jgi:hypothetical protein
MQYNDRWEEIQEGALGSYVALLISTKLPSPHFSSVGLPDIMNWRF